MHRQTLARDQEFLRVLAENLEFQRIAVLRQWETLLVSPMVPVIEQPPLTPRVQDIIQINLPDRA